jgi:integrase/recombinase XerD
MNRATRIRAARAEYLAMRRTLGYQLADPEHLLQQFVDYLDTIGADSITIDNALTWARQPAGADPYWWSVRLSTVRVFARYLHAVDPDLAQPIPPRLLPTRPCRAVPYLYSGQQVLAIMNATDRLRKPLRRETLRTLIGLLAATGMRVGEAIVADVTDLDLTRGTIRVTGKLGRVRVLPLHPSTSQALADYLQLRTTALPTPKTSALFVSNAGTRLIYNCVQDTFARLAAQAGVSATSRRCRPRIHDLRHSFAVNSLTDAYRSGADIDGRLALLSNYLGHRDPASTYWYLTGSPELFGLVADRLEHRLAGRRT